MKETVKQKGDTMTPEVKAICQEIKTFRKKNGLRQVPFAKQLGIVQPTLSKIERAAVDPSLSTYLKFRDIKKKARRA